MKRDQKRQVVKKTKRCAVCGTRRILKKMEETEYRNKNNKINEDNVFICSNDNFTLLNICFMKFHRDFDGSAICNSPRFFMKKLIKKKKA